MKPVNVNKVLAFSTVLFLLFACSGKSNLPTEKIARAYAEITFNEELYRGKPDSIEAHKKAVLKKYGLKESELAKTMEKIPADKKAWNEFFKVANFVLDSLRKTAHR